MRPIKTSDLYDRCGFTRPSPVAPVQMRSRRELILRQALFLGCAVLVLFILTLMSGCSTPPAVVSVADGLIENLRIVKAEGREWSDAQWEAELSAYAADARFLRKYLTEGIDTGDATRLKHEEDAR